jgi:DNA polymerase-3 subunit alpha
MKKLNTLIHVHSGYSLLDSTIKIDEFVDKAKEMGYKNISLTEHGNMFSVPDFYKKTDKTEGVKGIIGVETYIAEKDATIKGKENPERYHLVLLAKNNTGYKNLKKLVSYSYLKGFYYKPRIDKEILKKYSEGIIATSACLGGEINQYLLADDIEGAYKSAREYKEIFGKDFYLELQDHNLREQLMVNPLLVKLGEDLNIPLIVTNDIHYLYKNDADVQDVLLCLQTKKKITDEDRLSYDTQEFYLKSPEEMATNYSNIRDEVIEKAIKNTNKIGEECNVEVEMGKVYLPDFPYNTDKFNNLKEVLNYEVEKGLKKRFGDNPSKEVLDRTKEEIKIINNMGFPDYFLIVQDIIQFAKNNNIRVGPGRGSAAGSMVSYLLGITDLNPLDYDLLFERFLNPERVTMPDIDIDFETRYRDKVIQYTIDKYGTNRTAQIVTFGMLKAKSTVRDVTRVLDYPYSLGSKLSKAIPTGQTLKEALEENEEIKNLYNTNQQAKKVLDIAVRLEGLPRHTGVHAAGVVIAKGEVSDFVPVLESDGTPITQTAKEETEDMGLLKMDFLGLRNLDIIHNALDLIKERYGIDADIDNVDLTDGKTFKLFQEGKTFGVFQFESTGMQKLLRDLKPTKLEHLIAANALYRPGPNQFQGDFIAGRYGRGIEYPHPALKEVLKPTYGILLYQEQIMKAVQVLANFTLGEADILRRAIGKKKAKLLHKQKEKFIEGCLNNKKIEITKEQALDVFDKIELFAGYGFNKSHSAAYSLVSYQTAYLKVHYPLEYMTALLQSVDTNEDKARIYINEADELGYKINGININKSRETFSVESDKEIRIGIVSTKQVGRGISKEIEKERVENGDFKSFKDFVKRVNIASDQIRNLITVGAFDDFGSRKAFAKVHCDLIDEAMKEIKKENDSQMSLFSDKQLETIAQKVKIPDIEDVLDDKLKYEKEFLGYYVSGHPLDKYKGKYPVNNIRAIPEKEKARVKFIAYVSNIHEHITKNGNTMAFLKVEDFSAEIEVIVFPDALTPVKSILEEGRNILLTGEVTLDTMEKYTEEGEEVITIKKIIANEIKIIK